MKYIKKFFEKLSLSDNDISFNYSDNSDINIINTKFGKGIKDNKINLRKTKLKESGIVNYSLYARDKSDDTRKMLTLLKKYKNVDYEKYDYFLKRTAIAFSTVLKDLNVDTIITIESKSSLTSDLVSKISEILPSHPIIHINGLKKDVSKVWFEKTKSMPFNVYDHYDKMTFNLTNDFKIRDFKTCRSYLRDWIVLDKNAIKDVTNKNVVIFDDFITYGATLDTACLEVQKFNPKNLNTFTIIK